MTDHNDADGEATGFGDPAIDALAAEAADQQRRVESAAAVYAAETPIRRARQDEQIAQQKAAYRRVAAARGQLTRAQKNGSAAKISAAAERLRQRKTEAEDISDTVIEESHQLTRAGLDSLGDLLNRMTRRRDADDAVLDALANRRGHHEDPNEKDPR